VSDAAWLTGAAASWGVAACPAGRAESASRISAMVRPTR